MDARGARFLLMAVDRPPPLWFWFSPVVLVRSLVMGPVGKWETRLHRVFHFSIRAGSPFFFASFFFTNNPRFHRLSHSYASSSGAPTMAIGGVRPSRPALRFSRRR